MSPVERCAEVTVWLDFGLRMVAEFRGQIYAECTQLMSEYNPEPPFNAGGSEDCSTKSEESDD
ncbi:hypothetical protein [Pseudomonas syringae]|uniref:hypothetical protein n=1 Tax=Pseudomonas syringae TaxID=317 RepID=UPI0013C33D79|nr:hypothetical protein [Pseudomonas syringae]